VADAAAAAANPSFPLGAGETLREGPEGSNLVEWKIPDGTVIQLGIVATGKDAKGTEKGVLRAFYGGKGHDLETYTLESSGEQWATLKVLSTTRALFRFGTKGTSGSRRGVVLVWNEKAGRADVAKRWRGTGDADPAWLESGEYKAAPEASGLCAKVVARIVACEKDPAFREALFRHLEGDARRKVEADFATYLPKWRKPAEVKAQCQRWSSDEYADTQFSDIDRLKQLAEDTKLSCQLFGREVDDEGGLPRPVGPTTAD
jgi:hypothetical protein